MKLQFREQEFLSIPGNKQRVIDVVARLQECGCVIHHAAADADADVLIVKMDIASAVKSNTVLIADDTDLLVLLCYHCKETAHQLILKAESKTSSDSKSGSRCWNIAATRSCLGDFFVITYYSFMRFLVATPHPGCSALVSTYL